MPNRFQSKNIVTINPDRSVVSGKPPTFMPKIEEIALAGELPAAPTNLAAEQHEC